MSSTSSGRISCSSEPAVPEQTILDGGGVAPLFHLGALSSAARIEGFTIRNGFSALGGGIELNHASPTVRRCVITGNEGTVGGGGVYIIDGSPVFEECTIAANLATIAGAGGIHGTNGTSPVIRRSVIWDNCSVVPGWDDYGGGPGGTWTFECSLVDSSGDHGSLNLDYSSGDNVFGQDPLFCNRVNCQGAPTAAGTYTVDAASPCLVARQPMRTADRCARTGLRRPSQSGRSSTSRATIRRSSLRSTRLPRVTRSWSPPEPTPGTATAISTSSARTSSSSPATGPRPQS